MKINLNTLQNYLEDILVVLGLLCIIIASFLLSIIWGLYMTGAICVGSSVLLAKMPVSEHKKENI